MQKWKRLTAVLLSAVLWTGILAGCAEEKTVEAEPLSLAVCVGTAPVSLDPIYAQEARDQTILVHLYENLLRKTTDAEGNAAVTYGIAKSVEQEENYDGTMTYTFRLRSAKWSDGRDVEAEDFVYAWRRLANPASQSPYASLLSVVCGYEEARATGDMQMLQVTAKNDSTLVVVLDGVYDWFLNEVCTSPATMPLREDVVKKLKEAAIEKAGSGAAQAKAWWSDPVALVTNGPYKAVSYEPLISLTAAASERYYENFSGPTELAFHFSKTTENAKTLYEEGFVDVVWPLTEERITELAAEESWAPAPELSTYTVLYNCAAEPFEDAAIRQAMNLVIDRTAITEKAGVTAKMAEGFVPFGVPENEEGDFRTVGGTQLENAQESHEDRCREARQVLAAAGYDSGIALGELTYLYINQGRTELVAEELCRQWQEELNISVTPVSVTEQELWAALRSGAYTLAGVAISAASNDAECFLSKWTSTSVDNVIGYGNSAYDTLMKIIASAPDGTARMGCLHDAEALLLSDNALAPLYTIGTAWEVRDTLSGVIRDSRGWFCFSNVAEKIIED